MLAVVTSIGEITRDLCVWSLERNGFDVVLYENDLPLSNKLQDIYKDIDEDFVRVDADVVVNRNLTPEMIEALTYKDAWWVQFKTYEWNRQDYAWGGVQFIKKEALPILRANIGDHMRSPRPETAMSRLTEFYNPRRFESHSVICGLHSFGARDIERVKHLKKLRSQYDLYDWELSQKLLELMK